MRQTPAVIDQTVIEELVRQFWETREAAEAYLGDTSLDILDDAADQPPGSLAPEWPDDGLLFAAPTDGVMLQTPAEEAEIYERMRDTAFGP
jgi:hypothetical protein